MAVNKRINGKYRHGITLIGYDEHIEGNYISVWNSVKENYETLRYDVADTSFGMNNRVYHWASTFSFK